MLIFFWLNGAGASAGASTSTTVHPYSGIRKLTPAMLRKMQKRAERKAREKDDQEAAIELLLRH